MTNNTTPETPSEPPVTLGACLHAKRCLEPTHCHGNPCIHSPFATGGSPPGCSCHPDDNPPSPCPQHHALSDCRAAALSQPAPVGWVMVPREPTEEMIAAGLDPGPVYGPDGQEADDLNNATAVYRAMISAAPNHIATPGNKVAQAGWEEGSPNRVEMENERLQQAVDRIDTAINHRGGA